MTKQIIVEGSNEGSVGMWRKFADVKKEVLPSQEIDYHMGLRLDKIQAKESGRASPWNNREIFLAVEFFSLFVRGKGSLSFLDLATLWSAFFEDAKTWQQVRTRLGSPMAAIKKVFGFFGFAFVRTGLTWEAQIVDEPLYLSSKTSMDTFFDSLDFAATTFKQAEDNLKQNKPSDYRVPLQHAIQAIKLVKSSIQANEIAGQCVFQHQASCPTNTTTDIAIECNKRMREAEQISIAINNICIRNQDSRRWESIHEPLSTYNDQVAKLMPMWRLAQAYLNKQIGGSSHDTN